MKLCLFTIFFSVNQNQHANFYNGKPYTNQSQTTAEIWVDGVKLYNAASVKKRYHVSQDQIDCILKPNPNIVNEVDKHIKSLISEQGISKIDDFYQSHLGKLYLTRQHKDALKTLGFIPKDKDTRLPVKEGREVLKFLKSKPMSIINNLNKDYIAVGLMKAHAIDMKTECQLFELTPK